MLCSICLQRKEPVGDSEELPKNIVDGLEDITPEMLEVHFIQLVYIASSTLMSTLVSTEIDQGCCFSF